MANQHTMNNYCEREINKIISLYEGGMSFSKIGVLLNRQKNNIKKILNLTSSYVDKYLSTVDYRRTVSEGTSIGLVKRFSGINYNTYLKNLPEREKYRGEVNRLTKKQPVHLLDNYNKRGCSGIEGAYHLDHKYSIWEGFNNNINPEIITSLRNLVFIPWRENVRKRTKCSITKEELINI